MVMLLQLHGRGTKKVVEDFMDWGAGYYVGKCIFLGYCDERLINQNYERR